MIDRTYYELISQRSIFDRKRHEDGELDGTIQTCSFCERLVLKAGYVSLRAFFANSDFCQGSWWCQFRKQCVILNIQKSSLNEIALKETGSGNKAGSATENLTFEVECRDMLKLIAPPDLSNSYVSTTGANTRKFSITKANTRKKLSYKTLMEDFKSTNFGEMWLSKLWNVVFVGLSWRFWIIEFPKPGGKQTDSFVSKVKTFNWNFREEVQHQAMEKFEFEERNF